MRTYLVLLALCFLITGCAAPVASAAVPFTVMESDQLAYTPATAQTACDPCTEGTTLFPPEGQPELGNFPRGTGKPATETRDFHLGWDGDVCMNVTNNGCASTTITLNGEEIISPDQFNPDVGNISATKYLPGLPPDQQYPFAVTVASIPTCSVDVEVRSCNPDPGPQLCSEVATAWCQAKGWSVAMSFNGGLICVAPGYSAGDNCEGCDAWNLVVWTDFTGDPLCPGGLCTTLAGNYYGGHVSCECGDNLQYCQKWNMQDCVPD